MNRLLSMSEWFFICLGFALAIVSALAAPESLSAASTPTGSCQDSCAGHFAGHPHRLETCMRGCCAATCANEPAGLDHRTCMDNCLQINCKIGDPYCKGTGTKRDCEEVAPPYRVCQGSWRDCWCVWVTVTTTDRPWNCVCNP